MLYAALLDWLIRTGSDPRQKNSILSWSIVPFYSLVLPGHETKRKLSPRRQTHPGGADRAAPFPWHTTRGRQTQLTRRWARCAPTRKTNKATRILEAREREREKHGRTMEYSIQTVMHMRERASALCVHICYTCKGIWIEQKETFLTLSDTTVHQRFFFVCLHQGW